MSGAMPTLAVGIKTALILMPTASVGMAPIEIF